MRSDFPEMLSDKIMSSSQEFDRLASAGLRLGLAGLNATAKQDNGSNSHFFSNVKCTVIVKGCNGGLSLGWQAFSQTLQVVPYADVC